MVFPSAEVIASPLIFITLAMLGLMVAITVVLIRNEGHQPTLRLVATLSPPLLTLAREQNWHLFLSQ